MRHSTYEVESLQNQEYDEDHRMPERFTGSDYQRYVGYVAGRVTLEHWVDSDGREDGSTA